jgi:hypothetical protein
MRRAFTILAWLTVLQLGAAAAVGAQPGATPADAKQGVVVEQVKNGVLGGPDVKFTQVNGRDGVLVGGLVGALVDRTLFIGAAGYWLANGDWDQGLSYGGMLVQWHFFSRRSVNVSVGGLVGGGVGTGTEAWYGRPMPDPYPTPRHGHDGPGIYPPGYGTAGYVVYDAAFFVGEPQVNVVWHAADWMSVSAGIGYRGIAGAGGLDDQLRGATYSVAIRFGAHGK